MCPALVFVGAEQLSRGHPDFRPFWPGFVVPSDSEHGLRPGAAQHCAVALVAMHRGKQLVSAARSGLGPADPEDVNAPGGGVTEMLSLVQTQVRKVLLTVEVQPPSAEDRGFQ